MVGVVEPSTYQLSFPSPHQPSLFAWTVTIVPKLTTALGVANDEWMADRSGEVVPILGVKVAHVALGASIQAVVEVVIEGVDLFAPSFVTVTTACFRNGMGQ